MHGEVARGVEELLRLDRRTQRHLAERESLAGLADAPATLEELPRRPAVEFHDGLPLESPDPPRVKSHQPHGIPCFRSPKVTFCSRDPAPRAGAMSRSGQARRTRAGRAVATKSFPGLGSSVEDNG